MPRAREPKGRHYLPVGPVAPLVGVIASNLVTAHDAGRWMTDLAALTLILGHDILIRVLPRHRHQSPGSGVCDHTRGEPIHQGHLPRDPADC
jgi:hypothetical protein